VNGLKRLLKTLVILVAFYGLVGCSTTPTEVPPEFKLGKPVPPPIGCIEYRKRGGKC
jgi:hypothetical protein